jgi:anion-transporting  ArsA/GET3 family ATPase
MDIGSILFLLALLILLGLFIARPFFDRGAPASVQEDDKTEHEISALLAEQDRVLNALQELDFDHALGKIPKDEYPAQRNLLLQQGAEVLRQLDEYGAVMPGNDLDERVEAAIAERRAVTLQGVAVGGAGGPQIVMEADDEVEVQLAARRRSRQDKSAGFCPQCGRPVQSSDSFCPNCGKPLV